VIAPLLSSLTVIGTYLTFAATQGRGTRVVDLSRTGELILSVGTTLGVTVLSLCLLVPVRRLGLRLRPRYTFPGGAGRQALRLGWAGVVTVGAQQLVLLLMLALALRRGAPEGTYAFFAAAQTAFLLPWAVFAVPLATAVYPRLAAAHTGGDLAGYRVTLARGTRSVVLLCCLGAAALVALADPMARLLNVPAAAAGIAGFAPGLLGYGLFAVLSRALYARGETRVAAVATATGWAITAAAAVLLAAALPGTHRVLALSLANTVGMAALGVLLVAAVRRSAGPGALAGLGRAAAVGLAGALSGAAAGRAVSVGLDRVLAPTPAAVLTVLQGILVGIVVAVAFGAVAYALDRDELRPMIATLTRRLGRRAGRPAGDPPPSDGPGPDRPAPDPPAPGRLVVPRRATSGAAAHGQRDDAAGNDPAADGPDEGPPAGGPTARWPETDSPVRDPKEAP
jgi:putative peptidoglycan lipid II flippase